MANPDQMLIRRLQSAGEPLTVDSNPLARALGARLVSVDTAAGRVLIDFTPDETFLQGNGMIQGGAIAAMLDFAMAFAALAMIEDDHSVATANMTVNFLRGVRTGRVAAEGRVEQRTRRLIFARAELMAEGEPLAASASAVLSVLG